MPSPFPGMDPYLENPGLWPDVHHELISVSREFLNRQLRPKYHVRVEERVYISDENDPGRPVIIPDLRVSVTNSSESVPTQPVNSAVATVEPVVATTLIEDEIHEARLEIVDGSDRSVVIVIEVLSPSNKVVGSRGQASYQEKRQEVMQSPSHFVEIDLLREGTAIFARETLPPFNYVVHVSSQAKRPKRLIWPIRLRQRLPAIPIPLKPEDEKVDLDLQEVLNTAYDRAGYDLEIDYSREPIPTLTGTDAEWANELLASRD